MRSGEAEHGVSREAMKRLALLMAVALALTVMTFSFASGVAAVSITVPYSSVPVADADLDGNPATGAWGDALSVIIPLENGAASPYGDATLYAKHDGTFFYFRIDGKIDVPWTSATGNHFWLGMQISPSSTSHHSGGTWDGVFFGLWDGTDYTPQPTYPPLPVDTNGFGKPPNSDAAQDAIGKMRYSGGSAPYSFTAEWKKKLNTGDANDIAYAADGTTSYNFFVTTDSNGKGSQGGSIGHNVVTNANTMKFAPVSAPNTPPTVDMTAPNGGEVWSGGNAHSIRWNMSDTETSTTSLKVWINYSTDGGLSYAPIAGAQGISGLSNPCSFIWTLPVIDTTQARVRVTIVDSQGASASDSSLANFAIDSTSPTAAFNPSDGSTGVSTTTQVVVTFSENMNRSSVEQAFSLERLDTNGYVGGSITWSGNDMTFTPSSTLATGVVYRAQVNATAKDASDPGNSLGTTYTSTFTTADLVPPTISGVSATPSTQEAGGKVNVSASVSDNGMVSGVWIEVYEPGGALIGNYTVTYDSGSGRYFHEASYDHPGTYGFRLIAQDAAGNWNATGSTFSVVDTTPPTIQHTPVTEALKDSSTRITALITDVDSVSEARVDYTDVLGSRYNVSMTLNGTLYEFDIPGQPQLGNLTYFIWATDPSGNAARTPSYVVIVVGSDTSPPSISDVAAVPAIQNASLSVNISARVADNIALEGVGILIKDPQGQVIENITMMRLGASDVFYYERAYSALGVHSFLIWATDTSNNTASASGSFEIVDMMPPVFQYVLISPRVQEAGQPLNVSASVADNVAVTNVSVQIRNIAGDVILTTMMQGSSGVYWIETAMRTLGNFTILLSARDPADNVATYSGEAAIVDTTPPIAVVGPDMEVWIGSMVALDASSSYDNSAIVNFTWSFVYNGTDITLYGPAASFTFNLVGQYNITLKVVDAARLENTSVLKVTVITDTVAPSAPRSVLATPIAPACLKITWEVSESEDVAGYRVYRWNSTRANFELIADLPANATAYTDCGLEDNEVYSYWIVAFDLYGNLSPPSPVANGRTLAQIASAEGLEPFYQLIIAFLLVLTVLFAILWGKERRHEKPPQLKLK